MHDGGCIILDQLEREYTKDLVRLCLVESNTIPSTTAAATTTTTLNNNIYNHSPQEEGKGQEGGSDKRNGPNHINHDLHHLNSPFSLWSKMKKSPLFSLPRRSDGAVTADSCVL